MDEMRGRALYRLSLCPWLLSPVVQQVVLQAEHLPLQALQHPLLLMSKESAVLIPAQKCQHAANCIAYCLQLYIVMRADHSGVSRRAQALLTTYCLLCLSLSSTRICFSCCNFLRSVLFLFYLLQPLSAKKHRGHRPWSTAV